MIFYNVSMKLCRCRPIGYVPIPMTADIGLFFWGYQSFWFWPRLDMRRTDLTCLLFRSTFFGILKVFSKLLCARPFFTLPSCTVSIRPQQWPLSERGLALVSRSE